jgi:hypothetical protein
MHCIVTIAAFRARQAGRDWMRRVQILSKWRRQDKLWGTVGAAAREAAALRCACGGAGAGAGCFGSEMLLRARDESRTCERRGCSGRREQGGAVAAAFVRVAGCGSVGTSCTRDVVMLHTHGSRRTEEREGETHQCKKVTRTQKRGQLTTEIRTQN